MRISADDVMNAMVDDLRRQGVIGADDDFGPILTCLVGSMCYAINKRFDDRERQFEEFNTEGHAALCADMTMVRDTWSERCGRKERQDEGS